MRIKGDHNRVAQNDYYELEVHELTLNQLDVVPCPICEQRLIRSQMNSCNHCANEARVNSAKMRVALTLVGLIVALAFGYSVVSALGVKNQHRHLVATIFGGLAFLATGGLYYGLRHWLMAVNLSPSCVAQRKNILGISAIVLGFPAIFLSHYLPDGIGGWSTLGGVLVFGLAMSIIKK